MLMNRDEAMNEHATLKRIQDLPEFPERPEGAGDHEFLRLAARRGPILRDVYGIVMMFSYDHLIRTQESTVSRQMETETLRIKGIDSGPLFEFFSNSLLFSNEPHHKKRRAPLARAFARPLMEALRPQVRNLARSLIEPTIGKPETDFLADIAGPLPARVVAMVLGAPEEDIPHFTQLVYSAIRALSLRSDEVLEEAGRDLRDLTDYVADLLDERRLRGREDFLSEYIARTADADFSETELRAQIVTVVLAGSETTRAALTSTLSQLIQHPDQWALLRADPEGLKAAAAAEGLRYDPVIGSLARIASHDLEFDGVAIPEGTVFGASVIAALRDPAVYHDPDRFDITRADHPRWHPVFGSGAHRCLGEALARIEIEEALAVLAELSPEPKLIGPPPTLRGLGATRGISAMSVAL
jgi:cytochrome P450 family 103